MWMEKIRHGVLQVSTDAGERYVKPSLVERLKLVWMFRNFQILPEEVLSRHERALLDILCEEPRMERAPKKNGTPVCLIGTGERHTPLPAKKVSDSAFGKAHARTA